MNEQEISIIDHGLRPDDSLFINYHCPKADYFQKLIYKVDGIAWGCVRPETYGTIVLRRIKRGRKITVTFNGQIKDGFPWSIGIPTDILIPPNIADSFTIQPPAQRKRGFASIGLHNPKTPDNVGGVIRAAHAYGAASVAISGQRIDGRHIAASTNTTRAERHLPVYRGELRDLIPFGAVPVAVELVDGAVSLFNFQHPRRAFYIFGPEDSGLGSSVRDWCEHTVQIPTVICMNLAATVNVVLYDRACKEAT